MRDLIKKILKEEISTEVIYSEFDNIFDNLELEVKNDDGTLYVNWIDDKDEVVFERNHWGMFWVQDCKLYNELRFYSKMLSQSKKEFEDTLVYYLNQKYIERFYYRPIKKIENYTCLDE
jgi:hypothetical protein